MKYYKIKKFLIFQKNGSLLIIYSGQFFYGFSFFVQVLFWVLRLWVTRFVPGVCLWVTRFVPGTQTLNAQICSGFYQLSRFVPGTKGLSFMVCSGYLNFRIRTRNTKQIFSYFSLFFWGHLGYPKCTQKIFPL